jgi:hypothetical protein
VEPCFTADKRVPPIRMAREDILPEETTSALVQGCAVYQHDVHALAARPSDEDLRPFRRKALMGHFTPHDIEQVDARPSDDLEAVIPTVVVCRVSLHHGFHASVKRLFRHRIIAQLAHAMLVLEVSTAHGWTKPSDRWADGERPEHFHHILDHGSWTSQTRWSAPQMAPEAHAAEHERSARGWGVIQGARVHHVQRRRCLGERLGSLTHVWGWPPHRPSWRTCRARGGSIQRSPPGQPMV